MKLIFYFCRERETPPRFAQPGTFEETFARRWKALDDLERHQRDQLEKNIQAAKEKLEMEMENAIQEHRNMLMKQGKMPSNFANMFSLVELIECLRQIFG